MSGEIPKLTVAFGSYGIPQADVIQCRVHLGCTKEVSSFEVVLQNWDKKYSYGGTMPLNVGMNGHIDIGRGANVPQIITCRIESIKYESTPTENYLRFSGRCWGERLFRRVVTKTYENAKGEEIVKDLLDNFAGLSHNRGGTELVENTDTTYTKLEYENTPVFDILKYIAESADKQGVIGFDFRVAPDGKFEFFPRLSKTSSVNLSEKIEVSEYRKDIYSIRNKIAVYGIAEKSLPSDKDSWTESLTPSDGSWSTLGPNQLSFDTGNKVKGFGSIKTYGTGEITDVASIFALNTGKEVNANLYPLLSFWTYRENIFYGNLKVTIYDTADKSASHIFPIGPEKWTQLQVRVGKENSDLWNLESGFDWTQIKKVRFDCWLSATSPGSFWIDSLFFGACRYNSTQEDVESQNAYGLRELVEVDEELYSDNECTLRAKAILNHLRNPAEYLTLRSTVIDYGNSPLLPADKIHVTLPNENVDADFRIESVEYHVDAKTQTLEVTLELGREPPLLADYLYALRSKTDHVSRHKIARLI